MDKKLQKYIESYDEIKTDKTYELKANGGMSVLINQDTPYEVMIENETFQLGSFQAILLNAYENSIYINSNENINLTAVRFKGAGASFFYEEKMEELMYNPNEPIFLENNILENKLDSYFKKRFKASTLPFNIMKIIDLLDTQKSDYNIDEVLAIANVPRKILDKLFRLKVGMTFKTYASIRELIN